MAVKGNRGEWSEFYAFLKLLSDHILYAADEHLTLIPDSFSKILSIIRDHKIGLEYTIDASKDQINILSNHELVATIPLIKISSKLSTIFSKIKTDSVINGTFSIPEAEDLMTLLHTHQLKSGSSKKADLYLKLEDPVTGTHPIKGFSIKSQTGGTATLLNASLGTNFKFKIVANNTNLKTTRKKLIGLQDLLTEHESLEFVDIADKIFKKNLMMIDSRMPEIVAEMVKAYYLGYGKSVCELTEYVNNIDPLNCGDGKHFYEYKVQQLLRSIAFGMQPKKLWTGGYETHGGYIIVKEDGQLACYHTYDRDQFGKYLFLNTKFETPSTTRHMFGKVYEENSEKFINLNLQIRFIR